MSNRKDKHLIVSIGHKVYMALPDRGGLTPDHVLIIPVNHAQSCTAVDEDVWDEIQTFQQYLVQMWAEQDKDVVFFETAIGRHPPTRRCGAGHGQPAPR